MELLEQIKEMVSKKELYFTGNHHTESHYMLKENPDYVIRKIERELLWFQNGRNDMPLLTMEQCSNCGEHISYRLEGTALVPAESIPCFYTDFVDVNLTFPTGEVMAADWLKHGKDVIKHLHRDHVTVNALKGVALRIQSYAEGNIGHVYVGNTSPAIFRQEDTIFIARERYDEEDELIPVAKGAEKMGSICTDLWWVTLCDRQTYEQHAIAQQGEEKGKQMTEEAWEKAHSTFTITPGTYRLRYFVKPGDELPIYAKMTKIDK